MVVFSISNISGDLDTKGNEAGSNGGYSRAQSMQASVAPGRRLNSRAAAARTKRQTEISDKQKAITMPSVVSIVQRIEDGIRRTLCSSRRQLSAHARTPQRTRQQRRHRVRSGRRRRRGSRGGCAVAALPAAAAAAAPSAGRRCGSSGSGQRCRLRGRLCGGGGDGCCCCG